MEPTLHIKFPIFVFMVLSLGMHEVGHVKVASYFGDPTPDEDGMNTWNPMPHILKSFFSCLVIPAILWFSAGMFIGGAYARLDENRMRARPWGYFSAVSAGVAMNFGLCLVFFMAMLGSFLITGKVDSPPVQVFFMASFWNLFLMIFNLLPIPPLDGATLLRILIPDLKPTMDMLGQFGFFIILILVFTGALEPVFRPFIEIFYDITQTCLGAVGRTFNIR